MNEKEEFIAKILRKFHLEEGEDGITRVLTQIYRAGTINIKELSRRTNIPISVVSGLVNTMMETQLLSRNRFGVLYTEEGMKWAERVFGFYGYGLPECQACFNRPFELTSRFNDYWDTVQEAFEKRPGVDTTLDQALLDSESAVQKISFIYEKGGLEGKHVLVLGDDDFLGFTIAAFYKLMFPNDPHLVCSKMVIMDIDDRILTQEKALISHLSPNFNIEYVKHDLRQPFPPAYLNQFDTVLTDPPYSPSGATLFLSRAISSLKKGGGKNIYFSYAHRSPERMLELQQKITEMNLAIMEIIPNLNYYEGTDILGNTTQLFSLITTSKTIPIIKESDQFDGPIYTGEFNPKIRFYECSECGKTIEVSNKSEFKTIEMLKKEGCPFCKKNEKFFMLNFKDQEDSD